MYARRTTSGRRTRRLSWSVFGAASACVLAGAYLAVLRTSGSTNAGVTLLGGLIVVGLAAGLFHSIISPVGDSVVGRRSTTGGFDAGDVGGGGDCGG